MTHNPRFSCRWRCNYPLHKREMKLSASKRIDRAVEKHFTTIEHMVNGSLYQISKETMDRIEAQSISIPIESAVRTISDLNLVYALYGE